MSPCSCCLRAGPLVNDSPAFLNVVRHLALEDHDPGSWGFVGEQFTLDRGFRENPGVTSVTLSCFVSESP